MRCHATLIRRTVSEVDSAVPILSLKTFAQHLDGNLELWIVRAGATLFSVFGGLALVLATVGVYGVKAYSVARRTREIGIRMALGAQRGMVQWMILREGAVMLASGVLLGLLLAAATGKLLSGLLYNVGALDPLAFTLAPLVPRRRRLATIPAPRHADQSHGRAHRITKPAIMGRFALRNAGVVWLAADLALRRAKRL
jgi:ABC-type antimicrobial peptide transport system permease subunit